MKRYYLWLRSPADERVAEMTESRCGEWVRYEEVEKVLQNIQIYVNRHEQGEHGALSDLVTYLCEVKLK